MKEWLIKTSILLVLFFLNCQDNNVIPPPVDMEYDVGPAYSNDGSRIAYFSYGMRSNPPKPGLYITDTSGINRVFIADWGMGPTWLPGDTEIVFFNLSYKIYLINLNTGLISLLVDADFARFTAITKARQFLYFDASGNDATWAMTIYRKDLVTGLIDTLIGGEYPTISPDEKWLAFNRNGIFIYNLDNDSLVRLSPFGESPSWSSTRDEIVYTYNPPGITSYYQVYITNLQGQRRIVTSNGSFPHFSPDGNRIVYNAISSDHFTHIWIMNRDGGDKRQITF
jgi:Tol biopolymer transport system component